MGCRSLRIMSRQSQAGVSAALRLCPPLPTTVLENVSPQPGLRASYLRVAGRLWKKMPSWASALEIPFYKVRDKAQGSTF